MDSRSTGSDNLSWASLASEVEHSIHEHLDILEVLTLREVSLCWHTRITDALRKHFSWRIVYRPETHVDRYLWLEHVVRACVKVREVQMDQVSDAIIKASSSGRLDVLEFISTHIPRGVESIPSAVDSKGRNALHLSSRGGHIECVRFLLGVKGVDQNVEASRTFSTALCYASKHGHTAIVKLLLGMPGVRVSYGSLTNAVQGGHLDMARLLRERGANPYLENDFDQSPLTHCIARGDLDMLRVLVDFDNPGINIGYMLYLAMWNSAMVDFLCRFEINDINKKYEYEFDTLLHRALSCSRYELTKILLTSYDADIHATNTYGYSPLHKAAMEANEDVMKLILQAPGVAVNALSRSKETPLHMAASYGNVDAARLLLEMPDILLDALDDKEETPLHKAAKSGNTQVAQLLLAAGGAKADATNRDGHMPIHLAAKGGHIDVVKLFLTSPNVTACHGNIPLYEAAVGRHKEICEFLLANSTVDVNGTGINSNGRTALHGAVSLKSSYDPNENRRRADVVKLLLQVPSIDINAQDYYGNTPLHVVTSADVAELLLRMPGISANSVNGKGQTPLHTAVQVQLDDLNERCRTKIVKLLLQLPSVDISAQDHDGNTPLHEVASERVAKLLLQEPGISPNATNRKEETPLHKVIRNKYNAGAGEILRSFLDMPNISLNTFDSYGETPLYTALAKRSLDVAKLMLSSGKAIDVHAAAPDGVTPLHWAAFTGHADVVELLLEARPLLDVDVRDASGVTPVLAARRAGHWSVERLLLDARRHRSAQGIGRRRRKQKRKKHRKRQSRRLVLAFDAVPVCHYER